MAKQKKLASAKADADFREIKPPFFDLQFGGIARGSRLVLLRRAIQFKIRLA